MATNESILDRAARLGLKNSTAGMDVPEGYFEDFAARMAASLPDRAEAERPEQLSAAVKSSFWRRVRPYVYMAAMFAGIWLMLQMFAMMGGMSSKLKPMEQNAVLAEALSNDDFMFDYLYDDYSTYELYDEVIDPDEDYALFNNDGSALDVPEDVVLPDSAI